MTPGELRALADAATDEPWVLRLRDGREHGDEELGLGWDWDWDIPHPPVPMRGLFSLEADARLVMLAPSLAREVADLRDRIRDAAEGEEHLQSRCRSYCDYEGAAIHGYAAATLRALLAEYAERWGDT